MKRLGQDNGLEMNCFREWSMRAMKASGAEWWCVNLVPRSQSSVRECRNVGDLGTRLVVCMFCL